MEKIYKVLDLYAGIGGNRKLWENVDVTAVELNPEIAEIYKDFYPDDTVIIGDAHEYLLKHYSEFDFIWSSPPCQTHTVLTNLIAKKHKFTKYPDMELYQEIILLKHRFNGKFVVENVKPYYDYLIKSDTIIGRHPYWSNFYIGNYTAQKNVVFDNVERKKTEICEIENNQKRLGIFLDKYKIANRKKRTILRNCVHPDIGKWIFDCAFKTRTYKQETLF